MLVRGNSSKIYSVIPAFLSLSNPPSPPSFAGQDYLRFIMGDHSCYFHITNRLDVPLTPKSEDVEEGFWEAGKKPATEIPANCRTDEFKIRDRLGRCN
jgi:hypothetical protein